MKLKITAKTEEIAIMNLHKQQFTGLLVLFTLFVFPLSAQQKLSLDECRRMALEQNREIRIAQNETQSAAYTRKSAQTHYLPKINFGGAWLRTGKALQPLENDLFLPVVPFNTIDPATGKFNPEALKDPGTAMNTLVINPETGQPMVDQAGHPIFKNYAMLPADQLVFDHKNSYYARFTVSQPLFTGFKITEANHIARRAEIIAKEKEVLTRAEIIAKTDEAFWRVVSLQEKLKLANAYETLLDRLVTDLENMHDEGIITRNDVLKAQVKQNEAKLKKLQAENGCALSKMALAQVIGMEEDDIEIESDQITELPPALPASYHGEILPDRRAEIAMLKEKTAIMESKKNIERARFMPDIVLTGGYGWMNPNPYNGLRNEFGGNWSVGVVVSMPVFTWGERRNDLHAAKLKMESAELELNEAREMIDLQIRQNRYRYSEALKKAEMTALSKEQAEENMRITRENLTEGRSRLTELLEAQLQWENASSEHIDALVEMKTTLLELDKSTGEIYNYLN